MDRQVAAEQRVVDQHGDGLRGRPVGHVHHPAGLLQQVPPALLFGRVDVVHLVHRVPCLVVAVQVAHLVRHQRDDATRRDLPTCSISLVPHQLLTASFARTPFSGTGLSSDCGSALHPPQNSN